MNTPTKLLNATTSTAVSPTFTPLGQRVHVYAGGTFAASTLRLQASPDGVSWFDAGIVLDAATARGSALLGDGMFARLSLTVSGTTSVTAWVAFSDI